MKKGAKLPGLKLIGWQGIELQVPVDWDFVVESGGRDEGLMGFTSPSSKFELKWEKPKKKKVFSIDTVAENFVNKLQKVDKEFKILNEGDTKIFNHKAIYFHYQTGHEGYGMTWYCDQEEKFFVSLFAFKPDEHEKSKIILENLLSSIKCHPSNNWNTWALFDFSFKTPLDLKVENRKFMLGFITLVLSKIEAHPLCSEKTEVVLQYWSPANVKFKGEYKDLERWFEKHYSRDFKKRYKGKMRIGEFQDLRINGHKAKTFTSTTKQGLLLSQILGKNNTYLWYCSKFNRIYVLSLSKSVSKEIKFVSKKKYETFPSEVFEEILNSIRCH